MKWEYDLGSTPSTNVSNTGTDVIYLQDPGCWLQVSVWDGDDAGFGWKIGGNVGVTHFDTTTFLQECQTGFTLSDPDVVVAKSPNDGQIYAKVVGIDPENFVRTVTYLWNNSSGKFEIVQHCPCRYGAAWPAYTGTIESGFTLGRKCTSPNIDANEAGETAIVWTEVEEYYVEVTLGFPFPIPTTDIWKLKRGTVVSATGEIDDRCLDCSKERYVHQWSGSQSLTPFDFSGANSIPGFPVVGPSSGPTPNIEHTYPAGWFAHSDVAISEQGDSTYLSYVFMSHLYSGADDPLHVTQWAIEKKNGCARYIKEYEDFLNYPYGRPRIAAPTILNPGSSDFHVVLGFSGSFYDCETQTTSYGSNIGVIGVVAGVPINSWSSANIIDNAILTGDQNYDPCISYTTQELSVHDVREYLAISWTNRGSSSTFDKGEIISKLYQTSDAGEVDPYYSIVNEVLANDQGVSSIAGRRDIKDHSDRPLIAYNWAEPSTGNIEVKQSDHRPGLETLDGEIVCGAYPERPAGTNTGLLIFPNPTNHEFTLVKNERISPTTFVKCELTDVLGRPIPIRVNSKSLEVVPTKSLAPGVYKIKVETQTGVYHSNIEVKP